MSDANDFGVNNYSIITSNDVGSFGDLFPETFTFPTSLETIPAKVGESDNDDILLLGLELDAHSEIQENISNPNEQEPLTVTQQLVELQPVLSLCVDSEYDLPLLGDVDEIPDFNFSLRGDDRLLNNFNLPSPPFETDTETTVNEQQLELLLEKLPPYPPSSSEQILPVQEEELANVLQEAVEDITLAEKGKRKSSRPLEDIGGNKMDLLDLSMAARSNLRDDAMRKNGESNKQNVENVKRGESVVSPGTLKGSKNRLKKIKMHQLDDVNDPKIKRAKMARENREKKKQAEMELMEANAILDEKVQQLTRDLEKSRGTISDLGRANLSLQHEKEEWISEREELKASLQKEIDRNEKLELQLNKDVATPEQTVEIIDNFRDIVSNLPNKCEIEVTQALAEMRVPVISNEKIREIRQGHSTVILPTTATTVVRKPKSAPTPTRALKFKGVFDLREVKRASRTEVTTVPDTDDQTFR